MCARAFAFGSGDYPGWGWGEAARVTAPFFLHARRLLGVGMLLRARLGGGVSKANFQSRSRVPSLIKERRARRAACVLSWILKHGAQEKAGRGRMAALRIGFLSGGL